MQTNNLILESDDLVDIRIDGAFKAVFTKDTPESMGALSRLVSAFIGREITIISILANEPAISNTRDRQIRYDINCRAENGELINVEMSLNPKRFEPVRLEYYAGILFTGQDIKGMDRDYNDLKQAYQIAILAKERLFPDNEYLHSFEYYDEVHRISLNGRSRIITIELSKVETIFAKPVEFMSIAERWAVYFEYLNRTPRQRTL